MPESLTGLCNKYTGTLSLTLLHGVVISAGIASKGEFGRANAELT